MDNHRIKTDDNVPAMSDPIAFFITWPTYGTWLPGDAKGWVEFKHGWKLPEPVLELECASRMTEDACKLDAIQRQIVESQVLETCQHRNWELHAVNCRSNHIHIVVSAFETNPKKIRADIKAWCTRRLKERSMPDRKNWWAERGSIRWVWNQQSLATAVEYTTDGQDK